MASTGIYDEEVEAYDAGNGIYYEVRAIATEQGSWSVYQCRLRTDDNGLETIQFCGSRMSKTLADEAAAQMAQSWKENQSV